LGKSPKNKGKSQGILASSSHVLVSCVTRTSCCRRDKCIPLAFRRNLWCGGSGRK